VRRTLEILGVYDDITFTNIHLNTIYLSSEQDGRPFYVVAPCHETHMRRTLEILGVWDDLATKYGGIPTGGLCNVSPCVYECVCACAFVVCVFVRCLFVYQASGTTSPLKWIHFYRWIMCKNVTTKRSRTDSG
jgi:hypothetical protein